MVVEEIIHAIVAAPRPGLLMLLDNLTEVREPYAVAKLLVALTKTVATIQPTPTPQINTESISAAQQNTKPSLAPKKNAEPTPVPQKTTETSSAPKSADDNLEESTPFDWQGLLAEIEPVNEVIFLQLGKCEHELVAGTLHLYPRTKIIKNILDKPNNKQIIIDHAHGNKVTIHDAGEHPNSAKNDATLNKISDIMGGEVINYEGGNSPF